MPPDPATPAPVDFADPSRLDEVRRVAATRAGDQEVFDRVTALAASLLDASVSLLSFIDDERQVLASATGVPAPWSQQRELPLSDSLCRWSLANAGPLAIVDTYADPRVRDSPVLDAWQAGTYLGVPLITSRGYAVGALCVLAREPRAWSERDVRVLSDLAATVGAYLEARASGPAAPAQAGLNIAAVARRTGVAPDTLRKWERRYAILRPKRTPGGQRRYGSADIARVEWLRDRLGEGFRIGEAAALLEGGGEGAACSPAELRDELAAAARGVDAGRVVSLVEQAFTVHPLAVAVEEIAAPALRAVGDTWAEHVDVVGQEHLLSQVIRSRLQRLLADRRAGVRGTVVLACAPGEQHDLGLLALGVLLQADGWLVAYVGADSPLDASAAVAGRLGASLLCLSATLPANGARLAGELARVEPDGLRIVLGGAAAPVHERAALTVSPGQPLAEVVARLRAA